MPTGSPNCGRRAPRPDLPASLKLVLDTNVWLDWLVFADAGVADLKAAVAAGRAAIFIDAACAGELERVLAYPLQKAILPPDARATHMAECLRVAQAIAPGGPSFAEHLPVCRDKDDQKFLELARACCADYLVTKDLLLLELMRRKVRRTPFGIVTPAQLMPIVRAHT